MERTLELDGVWKDYDGVVAVRDVSLAIPQGEFFSFLGPSGCGKTTILRMISGFVAPTRGVIRLDGRDLAAVSPHRRPTALIFQNLALFPLMSVAENIGYGLKVRGVAAAERQRRTAALLELIALPGYGDKRIDELSGGQRQRIAIARALAVEPSVLLLDEPLSALDLKLRQHMRAELRDLQRRTGVTFVYITHDQGEALAMSDRVAVMSEGRIEQVGTSTEIYDRPRTPFVATFVGESNVFEGRIASAGADATAAVDTAVGRLVGRNPLGLGPGDAAAVYVRPERMRPASGRPDATVNRLDATVVDAVFEGVSVDLSLRRGNGTVFRLTMANDGRDPVPAIGAPLAATFSGDDAVVLPPGRRA